MGTIYMNFLSQYIENHPKSAMPVKEVDISQLENIIGKKFPKAYREFLLSCGESFDPISGLNLGFYPLANDHETRWIEVQQENAKENLAAYGFEHLLPKDYWVIVEMEGSDYIHYFFFDEGENPPVYGLSMADYEEEPTEDFFCKVSDSFSEYIQGFIDDYDPSLEE